MLNKVSLVGNLAREPEVRTVQTDDGEAKVAHLTIALNRPWEDNGDKADFPRVVVWRGSAKYAETLAKGDAIAVDGWLETGSYENDDGETNYFTRVRGNRIQAVNRRNSGNGNRDGDNGQATPPSDDDVLTEEDIDSVPF